MENTSISNKRRRTSLIDNNLFLNVIYTTLLTVNYNKEAYSRLKKENETTSSGIIRKRCSALMAKMSEPKLSSERIAATATATPTERRNTSPQPAQTSLTSPPDPLRDRYIHVHSCLYCSADPVNRIDPTGKGWKDEKAKEYAEKLKDNIDKRINTIENDIEKSENKIDELSRKNKDTAKESRKIERSAYRVQYSFDNNSLPSSVDGIGYIINPWIYNLKDTNGNWLYPSLHHSK